MEAATAGARRGPEPAATGSMYHGGTFPPIPSGGLIRDTTKTVEAPRRYGARNVHAIPGRAAEESTDAGRARAHWFFFGGWIMSLIFNESRRARSCFVSTDSVAGSMASLPWLVPIRSNDSA